MPKIKNVAVILTAAEAARQWAHNNPDKARKFIDQATGFVDTRTKGKYSSQISGFSSMAKKNLTGQGTTPGETVPGSTVRPDGRL